MKPLQQRVRQVLRLLYVEDSPKDAALILMSLKKEGLEIEARVIDSLPQLQDALKNHQWDFVLSDCHMPLIKVDDVLQEIRSFDKDLPFIAVSGAIGEEEAVSLLKSGAQDFVSKNNLSRLAPAIRRELQEAEDRRERRWAEQALRQSEERFQLALKGANDGLWDWDLLTNEVYFSPRWKSMLGYEENEIVNDLGVLEKMVHPDDIERFRENVRACINREIERFETEFRMKHREGHYIDVLSRAFLLVEGGCPKRLSGTHVDITERKKHELALLASEEQLRELSVHLQKVREEEKAHIAQEVHDELGATFTALNVDVHWLRKKVPVEMESVREKVSGMVGLVASAAESCSRIVTELRPGVLDDLGLLAAIEWQASEFSKRHGIACPVTSNIKALNLSKDQSTAVFRILQESLTNAAKHAKASRIEVMLLKTGNEFMLQIADNGTGLTGGKAERPNSHGVKGMQERAHYLGGELRIESEMDEGVRVILKMPLPGSGA